MNNKQKTIVNWVVFLILIGLFFSIDFTETNLLSRDFRQVTASDIATNLTATSAVNYTQRKTNPNFGIAVTNCIDLTNFLDSESKNVYHIKSKKINSDENVLCTLHRHGLKKVEFSVLGIS